MTDPATIYQARAKRIADAISLKKPDRVPVSVHWDYFPARWKGVSIKDAMYDHQLMFDTWRECMLHFKPDNVDNPFVLHGFGAILGVLDFQQLKWAGHGLPDNMEYQFVEMEVMKADEYDHFLYDPSDFMVRRFWPRVNKALAPLEHLPPLRQSISYLWGLYNGAFLLTPEMEAARAALMEASREALDNLNWNSAYKQEMVGLGFPPAAGGFAEVPFDALGDVFRGTQGIMMDLFRRPDKVLAACEKLLPIMIDSALANVNASKTPIVFIPLHKGLDNFLSEEHFLKFYWPFMKALLEALIGEGITPWVLVEGDCTRRLKYFSDVPPGKVLYHFEATDMFAAKKIMRDRCCIRGNVPASLLVTGTPEQIRAYCKKLIDVCGEDGGFILDAAAGLRGAKVENVEAMFTFTKEYGVY